jgi:hypothetical protein
VVRTEPQYREKRFAPIDVQAEEEPETIFCFFLIV